MAASPSGKLDSIWNDRKLKDIHPSKVVAMVDDYEVLYVQAEKIIGDSEQPWYEIILEGE